MPQAENEKKTENDDALRRFIDRLENWPEDEPPSPSELRTLRREIRLTEEEQEKLELLAENHIRRARKALAASSYKQAAAELARASQLRPMDPRPRVELAGIYLQRSLERDYGRADRQRALKLARKALELNPGDIEARQFLHDYRRMNADFLAVKYRRYIVPFVLLIVLIFLMIRWQGDWVVNLFTTNSEIQTETVPLGNTTVPDSREVLLDSSGLSGTDIRTEILTSVVGHRNDGSYVNLTGRLKVSGGNLGSLKILLKGRDSEGNAVFTIPWTVRDESDPILIPGDSEALVLFRWLADPETSIESLELLPLKMDITDEDPVKSAFDPEIIWDMPRPEGASLKSEIRDFHVVEAYDRQVVIMDLAVENTGIKELSSFEMEISLGSDLPVYTIQTSEGIEPGIQRGERRVWPIMLGLDLDADIAGRPLSITIRNPRS